MMNPGTLIGVVAVLKQVKERGELSTSEFLELCRQYGVDALQLLDRVDVRSGIVHLNEEGLRFMQTINALMRGGEA